MSMIEIFEVKDNGDVGRSMFWQDASWIKPGTWKRTKVGERSYPWLDGVFTENVYDIEFTNRYGEDEKYHNCVYTM